MAVKLAYDKLTTGEQHLFRRIASTDGEYRMSWGEWAGYGLVSIARNIPFILGESGYVNERKRLSGVYLTPAQEGLAEAMRVGAIGDQS